jgi:hypothetical protein
MVLFCSQSNIETFLVKKLPKPAEWSAEGLEEHIIRFVTETDQVSLL